jgi:hypothetical protein
MPDDTELIKAINTVHEALWPEDEVPPPAALVERLITDIKDRLQDWHEAGAEAGADMTLTVILSWYDRIDLDRLKTIRKDSRYLHDTECIATRRTLATTMAECADLARYRPAPAGEDEEEEPANGATAPDSEDMYRDDIPDPEATPSADTPGTSGPEATGSAPAS